MLEKEQNNPRCHRLRILALFESDLNHAKRVIIGRKLLHHMNDHNILPDMQYGSVPGKHCISAVLKKILCHDHLRVTKVSGAFLENDAVGCYDRLVNNLVLMLMLKLGIPKSIVRCIGELWDNVVHMIKTIYGISSVSYGSTKRKPLYGPGQGSTCGPIFWLLCYWVIVTSLDPSITAAKFISVCKDIIVEITGVSFVDDSSLAVTSDYIYDPNITDAANKWLEVESLVNRLSALGQHWEKLLFSTGGAINFQKSHWYLMSWLWRQGIPKLATIKQTPASIALSTGANSMLDIVPRIEPTQGFRTLGVYVTPSGQYSRQIKVLRKYAEQFKQDILSSHMTPSEAYCCLMMYIRPKLNYPVPCVSMTEAQCRHIQAPILEAILPKLHLNRHSPRAVLFAGPKYGGLSIPETYVDLGYGHLQYLVGHLKIGDDIGRMILSLITHTQLQIGSVTPFFQLQYSTYAKWIDSTWITDCWKFANRTKIELEIESPWVPTLTRQGDVALMDLALMFHLNHQQLRTINTCRLFLQVVTVSDIVTARGDRLQPFVVTGERTPHQVSHLQWPEMQRPPPVFWTSWRLFLQYFTRGRTLLTPLGPWLQRPHYDWRWYQDLEAIVWEQIAPKVWHKYKPVESTTRRTRHTLVRYQTGELTDAPHQLGLYPATVEPHSNGYFTVSVSATRFMEKMSNHTINLWQHTTLPEAFANTPPFFQHLISTPPTQQQCQDIAAELQEKTLVVCSDGACDRNRAISSFGTVFASSLLKLQLSSVVGPVDGHPALVTSYRSELSGIVATLYIIYRICQYYTIETGGMTLYCDNKGALKNAFTPIKAGVTPYFKTDHDLVEVAQALVPVIPILITTSWVKGHYSGKDRQYQHDLNEEADRIAGRYQDCQTPHRTIRKPLPPPNYRVRLLHDSSVITSKLPSILVKSIHEENIIAHIIRKAGWSNATFQKVHWESHERAFCRLPRFHQHYTAKLIHGLLNTNRQNHLYYGQSSLCPICQQAEETMQHVFSCPHPDASLHRQQALEDLLKTLRAIQSPNPVIEAIEHGFNQWHTNPLCRQVRAVTAGSLRGPDAVLTSAFHEQFREIGWYQFCLGRISMKWASAVHQYNRTLYPDTGLHWSSLLISALWKYSRTLWRFRNGIIHGATVAEQANKQIEQLRTKITNYYETYADNPDIVLPRHASLFTTKSMSDRLQATYDSMTAWLRSVEEAIQVVQHQEAMLRERTRTIFQSLLPISSSDTDSTYSYHTSTSLTSHTSLDNTVATTVTHHSSTSVDSSIITFIDVASLSEVEPTIPLSLSSQADEASISTEGSIESTMSFPDKSASVYSFTMSSAPHQASAIHHTMSSVAQSASANLPTMSSVAQSTTIPSYPYNEFAAAEWPAGHQCSALEASRNGWDVH